MSKLKAAVIGLGQAGSRFDEEQRDSIWSHVGAYLALPDLYDLVAGMDIDERNLAAFSQRCPSVARYSSLSELAANEKPDVVSIATPSAVRAGVFDELLQNHTPRAIICEKPLATDASTRSHLVELCKNKNIQLLVHYSRRYNPTYQALLKEIREGKIGDVTSITIRCSNRLWSIGSHAFDLLFYLSQEPPLDWQALPLPALEEGGEPAVDFICTFSSGMTGRVSIQGKKEILLFEVDVVGSRGRLQVLDNGGRLTYTPFRESAQYAGYRAPGRMRKMPVEDKGSFTFIAIAREAADLLSAGGAPTCTGEMARQSEQILDQLYEITKRGR